MRGWRRGTCCSRPHGRTTSPRSPTPSWPCTPRTRSRSTSRCWPGWCTRRSPRSTPRSTTTARSSGTTRCGARSGSRPPEPPGSCTPPRPSPWSGPTAGVRRATSPRAGSRTRRRGSTTPTRRCWPTSPGTGRAPPASWGSGSRPSANRSWSAARAGARRSPRTPACCSGSASPGRSCGRGRWAPGSAAPTATPSPTTGSRAGSARWTRARPGRRWPAATSSASGPSPPRTCAGGRAGR